MPARFAYSAGMKGIQYTIRGISPEADAALRKKARARRCSINELAVEALEREAGRPSKPILRRDIGFLVNSMVEDPVRDEAIAAQRNIDPDDWK